MPTEALLPEAEPRRVRLEVRGLDPRSQFFRLAAVQRLQTVDIMEWFGPATLGETKSFTTADLVDLGSLESGEPETATE